MAPTCTDDPQMYFSQTSACLTQGTMPTPKCEKYLFNNNVLHLEELEKNIREPQNNTENEPMPYIHIGRSGQDIKTEGQIHVICN